MRLERPDEVVPGVCVADLDVFVFVVLVELGVVGCREVLECWCHFGEVDEGVVETFKENTVAYRLSTYSKQCLSRACKGF